MVCFSVITPLSHHFLWFLLALQLQMTRKDNPLGLVRVYCLAIESVFTCYFLVLYVCVNFLKYIGLSILEAVGWAGSSWSNSWATVPSAPFDKSSLPIYHLSFLIPAPLRISAGSFKKERRNLLLGKITHPPVPHWERSVIGTGRFSKECQLMLLT